MPTFSKPHIRSTVAQIDLSALQRNFARLRSLLAPDVEILAPVKGDAYGHGAARVALALQDSGCQWFGVALVEEGRILREAGVTAGILVLSGSGVGGVEVAVDRRLTSVVFDLDVAARLNAVAAARGVQHRVHLKIDTGMGRLGVPWSGFQSFVAQISALESLHVEGLMSHLASAEGDRAFTELQGARFVESVAQARGAGMNPTILHLANSAGVFAHPELGFDMVRPGVALYGAAPAPGVGDDLGLEPVMTVRTAVLLIRDVAVGEGVSYGLRWRASRPSRIAWLPVGYADGYPRTLSDCGEVLIRGMRAPVRGTVCMDLMAIDVTDIPGAIAGDEVVLLGAQGEALLRAEELAVWAGTIPYDIVCGFSNRVPRRHLVADGLTRKN